MHSARTVLVATLVSLALAGCCRPRCCPPAAPARPGAVRVPAAPAVPAAPVRPAPPSGGLLGDTRDFRPNPERPGTWLWTKPGVDLRSYDDLLIEEVRVQPTPGSAFAALPEADRAAAAGALRDALVRTVAPYYDVVETPTAHTLRLRVALTSVPSSDGTGVASLEAEMLDGPTESRLVAVLGSLPDAEVRGGDADVSPAERANRIWASRLLRYLDTHVR
jgi:hypothetical protein